MTPTPMARRSAAQPAQKEVAASRERFLTRESPERMTVRDAILASWRRSHELHVAADKIEMSYEPDVHLDTRLTRSALPVLRTLREQLEGQSVSVILTDPTGLVLTRMTGDSDLESHLDKVLLAPGFSYAEKFVGTNGIGTALEMGGPAHVFGHEHYAEHLEDLACAGVPIHHPISGRLVGAVDLTCWRKDAGALLLTLAKTTVEQIKHSLLMDAGSSELGLFQEYLRTCGRTAGIVFALNYDVVMLNDFARTVLEPADQAVLLAQATEALATGQHSTLVVELPSGQSARMYSRSVRTGDLSAGIVAHVKLAQGSPRSRGTGTGTRRGGCRCPVSWGPDLPGSMPAKKWNARSARVSGSLWMASPGSASWRSYARCSCGDSRSAGSSCSTPPTQRAIRTGCRTRGRRSSRTPTPSSSGTCTRSTALASGRSPPRSGPRRTAAARDRCGSP